MSMAGLRLEAETPTLRLAPELNVGLRLTPVSPGSLTAVFYLNSSCCDSEVKSEWSAQDAGSLRVERVYCSACGQDEPRGLEGYRPAVILRRSDYSEDWSPLDTSVLEEAMDEAWDVLTSELYLTSLNNSLTAAVSEATRSPKHGLSGGEWYAVLGAYLSGVSEW